MNWTFLQFTQFAGIPSPWQPKVLGGKGTSGLSRMESSRLPLWLLLLVEQAGTHCFVVGHPWNTVLSEKEGSRKKRGAELSAKRVGISQVSLRESRLASGVSW